MALNFPAQAVLAAIITAASAAGQEIRWLPETGAVEVTGTGSTALPAEGAPAEEWARRLAVRTGAELPPMLGKWTVMAGGIRFTPRFPLTPGLTYEATWHPAQGEAVRSRYTVPQSTAAPAVVTHIFPGGTVPENLLKFYLHFSAPMSGGGIYQHLHLRNASGREVELPFLELAEELWDRDMMRLTLFIDPGRVKREVQPLEEAGPALVAGEEFTLTVDAAWRDAAGRPLQQGAVKKFRVTAPDRTPPDPRQWRITPPRAGSRDPLRISFSEPLDHALALRLITVRGLPGRPSLDDGGTDWSFVPAKAWPAGTHWIDIQPALEDLAGNSIGKPFEVNIGGGETERPAVKAAALTFETSPAVPGH